MLNIVALVMMSNVSLGMDYWSLALPRFIQGFGQGFIFPPLQTLALATVRMHRLRNATAAFNVVRNVGGSIGIAVVTSLLARRSQYHQATLVGHINQWDAETASRMREWTAHFVQHGADSFTASRRATAMVYRELVGQAQVMTYGDEFWLLAMIFVAVLPLHFSHAAGARRGERAGARGVAGPRRIDRSRGRRLAAGRRSDPRARRLSDPVPGPAGAPEPVASAARRWAITMAVMVVSILQILDTSITNVALPHMQGALSAGVEEISWVITSYLAANAVVIPATGWLSARFGRRRFFLACTAVFTASSFLSGLAPNVEFLVGMRVLQGLGGGPVIPMAQAVLWEVFPPRQRGMAMAVWGSGSSSRRPSAPRWAAGSPTTGRGAGSSTSTCRSASSGS